MLSRENFRQVGNYWITQVGQYQLRIEPRDNTFRLQIKTRGPNLTDADWEHLLSLANSFYRAYVTAQEHENYEK